MSGLEPLTSATSGQHSNQLSYIPNQRVYSRLLAVVTIAFRLWFVDPEGVANIYNSCRIHSFFVSLCMEIQKKKTGKMVTIKCDHCEIDFEKRQSEYKRSTSMGRQNFCSRSCVGKHSHKHLTNSSHERYNVSRHAGNRKDEYTDFRYYMKHVKSRYKEYDITLDDLKDLWELQKGICPYSNINLKLSTHTNTSSDIIHSASLDRIDSSKGYIKGNIQYVSLAINYMKSTMSHEETIQMCKIIAENYKSS